MVTEWLLHRENVTTPKCWKKDEIHVGKRQQCNEMCIPQATTRTESPPKKTDCWPCSLPSLPSLEANMRAGEMTEAGSGSQSHWKEEAHAAEGRGW